MVIKFDQLPPFDPLLEEIDGIIIIIIIIIIISHKNGDLLGMVYGTLL
jgi:hypothetical protein